MEKEALKYLLQDRKDRLDGFVEERQNSIANALDLRLSCINPSIS